MIEEKKKEKTGTNIQYSTHCEFNGKNVNEMKQNKNWNVEMVNARIYDTLLPIWEFQPNLFISNFSIELKNNEGSKKRMKITMITAATTQPKIVRVYINRKNW